MPYIQPEGAPERAGRLDALAPAPPGGFVDPAAIAQATSAALVKVVVPASVVTIRPGQTMHRRAEAGERVQDRLPVQPGSARFSKEALAARLRFAGDLYAAGRPADVWCLDWAATLDHVAEWYPQLIPNQVIAYLDPPCWSKSPKLYRSSFDPAGGYAERNPVRPGQPA